MSTTAYAGDGSKLKVSISSVFTNVAQAKGFKVPSVKQVFDDTTNLDSPAGFGERIAVGKDYFDVPFSVVWNPADPGQAYLETAANTSSLEAFKLTLNNSVGSPKTYAFSAYVEWEPDVQPRKGIIVNGTLKGTGAITITN